MVRGGGKVSVLKAEAKYPGDLGDDSQWLAAERVVDGKLSRREVGEQNYSLWTLPKKTSTRAIRFTHDADVTERDYAGRLLGAFAARRAHRQCRHASGGCGERQYEVGREDQQRAH